MNAVVVSWHDTAIIAAVVVGVIVIGAVIVAWRATR